MLAQIGGRDVAALVHVRRGIAVVLIDEGIVEGNLGHAELVVVVGVVETEAIGQRQLLDGGDVGLNLTENLLGVVVVVVVLDGPVGVGDAVGGVPRLRGVERAAQVLAVNEADVAGELQDTVDHRGSLIGAHGVGLRLGEVHARGELEPVGGLVAATVGDGVTGVSVLVAGDDTIVVGVAVAQVVGHLVVFRHTVERHAMAVRDTGLVEVLDVVLQGGVLMDELLVVPDGSVDLCGAVEFGTPRAVLDEGLLSVPSLSELVLELGQRAH